MLSAKKEATTKLVASSIGKKWIFVLCKCLARGYECFLRRFFFAGTGSLVLAFGSIPID